MSRDERLRILIAENHPDLSEVMSRIIDSEPDMHCVGQVTSADEVVSAARDSDAQVVILDLMLQGGSGMALIEKLKAALPDLRIIIFSGHTGPELERGARERGAAAFLHKGCDLGVLLNEIRRDAATHTHQRVS